MSPSFSPLAGRVALDSASTHGLANRVHECVGLPHFSRANQALLTAEQMLLDDFGLVVRTLAHHKSRQRFDRRTFRRRHVAGSSEEHTEAAYSTQKHAASRNNKKNIGAAWQR